MAYKKFFFVFIIIFSIVSCYRFSLHSFYNTKKTIEIGEFSEIVNIPKRSFSFDLKKSIENYIMKHNPSNLVLKDGDVLLKSMFLNYAIIPMENYPLKKMKVTVKVCYIDHFEPKKNWEKSFIVFEKFFNKKNLFSKELIDKIIEKLTIKIYHEVFQSIS
jgi:hypothetical protein